MSTISDKIISAGIELGEQIAGNVGNWWAQEQTMREMIAAALADARREGAEAMREAADQLRADADEIFPPSNRGRQAPTEVRDVVEWYSESIRALPLPLPAGERQAVLLTDDDVWKSDAIMSANEAAGLPMFKLMRLVHAIQAASLAANNLDARRDFAMMPPAGKRDSDGVQRVACSYYVRGHFVDADKMVRPCRCGPDGCADSVECPRR